jgi:hypothetical protein
VIANFAAFKRLLVGDPLKQNHRKDAFVRRCKDFVYKNDLLFCAPSNEKSGSRELNITLQG